MFTDRSQPESMTFDGCLGADRWCALTMRSLRRSTRPWRCSAPARAGRWCSPAAPTCWCRCRSNVRHAGAGRQHQEDPRSSTRSRSIRVDGLTIGALVTTREIETSRARAPTLRRPARGDRALRVDPGAQPRHRRRQRVPRLALGRHAAAADRRWRGAARAGAPGRARGRASRTSSPRPAAPCSAPDELVTRIARAGARCRTPARSTSSTAAATRWSWRPSASRSR